MTLNDVINDAYIKNGTMAPGDTLAPELSDYAIREANRMLDQWNIQSLFIWTVNVLVFNLTALNSAKYWYNMGPSSAGSVDFDAPRPTRIEHANLLLTSSNPNSRVALNIRDDAQYNDITTPALGTTIPTDLWDNGDNPIARIYLWPYPTATQNKLELFCWNQIPQFVAGTDTFQMPPGYTDAFMLSLSERLIEGQRAIPATLAMAALKARAMVKGLNSQSPTINTTDSGMPGSRRTSNGNFYNGWPTTTGA